MIILVGFYAMAQGRAAFSEVMVFRSSAEKGAFPSLTAATPFAFFAMRGFKDSANAAEEIKDPVRIFPRIMPTGLAITARSMSWCRSARWRWCLWGICLTPTRDRP